MLSKFLLIMSLCQIFPTMQAGQRRFNVNITNITCSYGKPITRVECDFKKINKNLFTIDFGFMTERNLAQEIDGRLLIQVLPLNGKKTFNFIDLKMNLCDGLAMTHFNPLVRILMEELRRTSNVPYWCPMEKDILYQSINYTITEKTLPTYTPHSNFTVSLMFYEKDRQVLKFMVKAAVIP